jgi:hypothetical protein
MPAVGAAVARWLLGTEPGRYLLLAAIVLAAGMWAWDARFSAGRASVLAEQAAAADRAKVAAALNALDNYMAGAKASADIGAEQEQRHADALAARDRTIADLRAGNLRLRDHWACTVPADAAAGPGAGGDDAAERRREGAGDLVRVADTADADLAACQAQVTLYQRIGVLRVDPVNGLDAGRTR